MRVKPQRSELGPLEIIEFQGEEGAFKIILFHGYGADAADLAPLATVIDSPPGTHWIFPEGPAESEHGFGRAWFPIDERALEEAMRTGRHRDFSKDEPAGFEHARELALEMIHALNVPADKLILGGFSQGAMLATDIAFRLDKNPAGLIILSGSLVNETDWSAIVKKRAGLKFFQSHGRNDAILNYAAAQNLEKMLLRAGLKGQLLTFAGGHEISQEVIESVSRYILKITGPAKSINVMEVRL